MKKCLTYGAVVLALALAAPVWADASAKPADSNRKGVPAVSKTVSKDKAAKAFTPDGNMARADVPDLYKWDLSALFPDQQAFDEGYAESLAGMNRLASYKGKLADPETLALALDEYFKTRLLTYKLKLFAGLANDMELADGELSARNEKAMALMNKFMGESVFVRDEVLALSDEQLEAAYGRYPKIKEYKGWIDQVRRRKAHTLEAAQEKLLAMVGDNQFAEIDLNELPSGYEKAFKALYADLKLPVITDEKGQQVQLTWSNYGKYRSSSDRRVRQETVEKFFQTLQDYRHAFAADMAGQIEFTTFLARARGYDSSLEAYLDHDNIQPYVYYNLINTVKSHTAPLQRYISLRKKVMKLDDIHIYDLYTPLVNGVERDISYDEAIKIIPKALAPLGSEYIKVLTYGLDPHHGWVDVYPHKDKDSGASCAGVFGVHPFVKLNHFDSLNDVSTVAHEFGHALHSHLTFKNQPYATANYTPFVAEIASTCNEKLLSDYLLANAKDDDERLYLLNEMVNTIRTTIYRQTLFADFELQAHQAFEKGTPITAELLDGIYRDLLEKYYGPEFTIDANDGVEWAYIPHLYYKYYVFSYATGLSSGISIADNIKKNGQPAADGYLKMLSSGCSKSPAELLKMAGVDLSKPDFILDALKCMDDCLDQMETILKKQGKI